MVNKYGILFQFRLVFVIRSQKTVEVIQIQCFFMKLNFVSWNLQFCFLFFLSHSSRNILWSSLLLLPLQRTHTVLNDYWQEETFVASKNSLFLLRLCLRLHLIPSWRQVFFSCCFSSFTFFLSLSFHLISSVCVCVWVWVSAHTNTHTR